MSESEEENVAKFHWASGWQGRSGRGNTPAASPSVLHLVTTILQSREGTGAERKLVGAPPSEYWSYLEEWVSTTIRTPGLYAPVPSHGRLLAAKTQARDPQEALDRVLSELSLMHGIWELTAPVRTWSSRARGEVFQGRFKIGPIFVVHGSESGPLVWFDRGYPGGHAAFFSDADGMAAIKTAERWRRNHLRALTAKHRAVLELGIRRFAAALDSSSASALRLWSVLELLTDRKPGEGADLVVRRTAGLALDGQHATEVLELLRSERNAIAHDGHDDPSDETSSLLRHYCRALIKFHLGFGRRMGSVARTASLLDAFAKGGPGVAAELQRLQESRKLLQVAEKVLNAE